MCNTREQSGDNSSHDRGAPPAMEDIPTHTTILSVHQRVHRTSSTHKINDRSGWPAQWPNCTATCLWDHEGWSCYNGQGKNCQEATFSSQTQTHKLRNKPLGPIHPWEFPQEPWYSVHVDSAGPFGLKRLSWNQLRQRRPRRCWETFLAVLDLLYSIWQWTATYLTGNGCIFVC